MMRRLYRGWVMSVKPDDIFNLWRWLCTSIAIDSIPGERPNCWNQSCLDINVGRPSQEQHLWESISSAIADLAMPVNSWRVQWCKNVTQGKWVARPPTKTLLWNRLGQSSLRCIYLILKVRVSYQPFLSVLKFLWVHYEKKKDVLYVCVVVLW